MQPVKALLTLIAALAFALSPVVTGGFAGFSPEQFPVPQVAPPIQPAGWAFSIWLPIYAWLILSAGLGLLRHARDPDWDRPRWPLLASLTLGAAWVPLAQASPVWATVLIWAMLATALAALIRTPLRDRAWLAWPIGLYAGWLTAASCVASAILATGYGAAPVVPIHAAFILLALGIGLITLRFTASGRAYAAGLGWALVGILAANANPPLWPILAMAAAGLVLLVTTATRHP